jgi:pyridinium-3,5-biscarboxylic acid mononucleotide synthase
MDKKQIEKLYKKIRSGKMDLQEAVRELRSQPFVEMGFAKFDTHRNLRTGFPEVIFCKGKALDHIGMIVKKMKGKVKPLILTKADKKIYARVKKAAPKAVFHERASMISIDGPKPDKTAENFVLVITAGTADIPVAEEAAVMSELTGNRTERLFDVGVAGLHRLLGRMDIIMKANVLVVVAGMEGALPSIIAGLVDKPVIAVPTSVGYGANFKGIGPLLTMLNSCAPGIAVVNIDNGFGAGYLAAMINKGSK